MPEYMTIQRMDNVAIVVEDLDAAVAFFTPAAVGTEPENPSPDALGLHRVMFAVDDIDDTVARLRAHGAELLGEVAQYESIVRLCYLRPPRASSSPWPNSCSGELPTLTYRAWIKARQMTPTHGPLILPPTTGSTWRQTLR